MVTIREVAPGDMEKGREWMQDHELQQLVPPDPSLMSYAEFAIEVDSKLIGFCNIADLTSDQAELGIWIGDKSCWGKGHGTEAMKQLVAFCFSKGLKRVYLKTLWSNSRAIRCYEKCGFTRYGTQSQDGHSWVLMELYNNDAL